MSDFLQGFFSNLVGILRELFGSEDLQGFVNLAGREVKVFDIVFPARFFSNLVGILKVSF
jgi:hypothetical protein